LPSNSAFDHLDYMPRGIIGGFIAQFGKSVILCEQTVWFVCGLDLSASMSAINRSVFLTCVVLGLSG
jgi:hypothetical protein